MNEARVDEKVRKILDVISNHAENEAAIKQSDLSTGLLEAANEAAGAALQKALKKIFKPSSD